MDDTHLTEDQKDIRLLADILALVLDEEQGQANAALETLRQRARKRKISGGTLKNLFRSLAEHEQSAQAVLARSTTTTVPDSLADRHRRLQSEYALLQEENAQLSQYASFHTAQAPLRRAAIVIALVAGLLGGIAGTQLVHTLTAPPRIDPALCLHT
ncbi:MULTISPECIES: hypothetical protein [unclassified Saccharibacter]|uniref:hypothetical protein n=1 Tax=unclassified Saccharibacter TaxID=2648722 RepID=UPI00132A7BCE|nr:MULTISPECIES: hypothetical protein [unclassified Saccharibacter]MXV35010.1 hypothetical protein [Saccharibacter sp. EH611]MXV57443.1 hypothetical protein [Saccharibacter sp. EH70]MXV64696.1 hypothetical protein [Saccharibacter sp. EH60]